MYRKFGKRALDLAISVPALVLFSPVLLLTALVLRRRLGKPVLWRETRPGRGARPFVLCKFRTMLDTRDAEGNLLRDAERMEPVGTFIRSASLDELPQLWNVVKGEMSLVGPRPLVTRYLPRYTPEQFRRHEVLPGITGWAQVNGRNDIPWERKFQLDTWYVDHCGFWLDMKILWMTVLKTFKKEGINAAGHATAPEFEGTARQQPSIEPGDDDSVVVADASRSKSAGSG
ncbi:MAG: sugar transferase [Planctomycetia bacterium]|nr:sugar transferase [Planctomycetia bacterium]